MIKYKNVKRVLDVLISALGLIFALFPMLVISFLILILDGAPIIFKQKRIGRGGREFVCYKFRTMKNNAPHNLSTSQFKNVNQYVTKTGKLLRKTSLDELPQVFNVIKGDMSIVGPRPLIPEEKALHIYRKEAGIYDIRPGITGLAQICGRDELTDSRKLECDQVYTNNISFLRDTKILWRTIKKIIAAEGVKAHSDT